MRKKPQQTHSSHRYSLNSPLKRLRRHLTKVYRHFSAVFTHNKAFRDILRDIYHLTAFFRCGKLTEIGLPAGLTEIADQTFDHCASLTSVFIPSGVAEIGESAFNCCSALKTVDIPASVKSIGYSAFNSCKKLETVYYSGSTSDWEKIEIDGYNKRLLDADLITSGLESPAPASSGSSIAGGKLK